MTESDSVIRNRRSRWAFSRFLSCIATISLVSLTPLCLPGADAKAPAPKASSEWSAYAGTNAALKYSSLDQINKDNVKNLRIVWRQSATPKPVRQGPGAPVPINYSHTPLMVGGMLYMSTGYGTVAALDPSTGEVIWFDPPPPRNADAGRGGRGAIPADLASETVAVAGLGQAKRGLAYWTDGTDARVITTVGRNLVALSAKTGKRYPDFGENGAVDLTKTYDFPVTNINWGFQPLVVRDVIVVAGIPSYNRVGQPADLRGFDIHTGKQLWTFHVVPRPGEFGNETYLNNSWENAEFGGAWSMMSADDGLGYIYVPLKSVSTKGQIEYYDGKIPGDNLFGESLLCLDAKTGKRVWHFQTVHHGIWDWDLPAAPILADLTVNGKKIKAVIQVTKQSFIFAFDRVTGKPIWPIEERPVPKGDAPGEWYSPTQPYPTKPPPYDIQDAKLDDLVDFTPELRQEALKIVSQYRYGHMFLAPSLLDPQPGGTKGTLQRAGTAPTTWNGAAFDPETGYLYVPSVHMTAVLALTRPTDPDDKRDYILDPNGPFYGYQLAGPQGLPDPFKPPYGRITAINMNKGEIAWMAANGDGPRDNPALKGVTLPPLGQQGRAAPLATKTLLFLGEGGREGVPGLPPQGGGKMFRAFDKKTGKILWETELPGGTTGAPMTYMLRGKQYIVVGVGWKDSPGELIALALP